MYLCTYVSMYTYDLCVRARAQFPYLPIPRRIVIWWCIKRFYSCN